MADTSDIKNGLTINFNHGIWSIVEFLHVKPGKGAAFVRTKMKNLVTGKVLDHTFPSGHKLDIVRIERRSYQYLYRDAETYHFMEGETFEQIPVQKSQIPGVEYLLEGMICEIQIKTDDGIILTVDIPTSIIQEVTYTEPGVKGDTATNTLKPATLESGASAKVPLFINIGDRIKVNTSTGEYQERAKK